LTFAYLGWLCGGDEAGTALRATGLLHAFALIQGDVMDKSVMRRGRTSASVPESALPELVILIVTLNHHDEVWSF
jgi:Polyprenyl synthetase